MAAEVQPGKQVHNDNGALLGVIRSFPDGKIGVWDTMGNLRGIYDPERDETRDWRDRRVGNGNLLESLIGGRSPPQARLSGYRQGTGERRLRLRLRASRWSL